MEKAGCILFGCCIWIVNLLVVSHRVYGVRLEHKLIKNILAVLSAQMSLVIFTLFIWVLGTVFYFIPEENMNYSGYILTICFIQLAVILIFTWIIKRYKSKCFLEDYTGKEMFIYLSGQFSVAIMLYAVIWLSGFSKDITVLRFVLFIFALSGLTLFGICYLMLASRYQNRYMKLQQEDAVRLLTAQEEYYKMLLKKEEQTKAFRHDMRNHLYCIGALLEEGNAAKLRSYLNELDAAYLNAKPVLQTGVRLIDIIIADLQNRYPFVDVRVFGTLQMNLTITEMDICTVFSNLLTNAFEAADQCKKKEIQLHLKTLDNNLYFDVSNSVADCPVIHNNEIRTTKTEHGHGYGIRNVKECLRKYNGELELKYEEAVFNATVIIPDVIGTSMIGEQDR